MIFQSVGDDRPYPAHGRVTPRDWADVPPRAVRLEQLTTTKSALNLHDLLADDSGELLEEPFATRRETALTSAAVSSILMASIDPAPPLLREAGRGPPSSRRLDRVGQPCVPALCCRFALP